MKTIHRSALVVLTVLFVLLAGSCGPAKYTPKPNEELYGIWVNKSYSGQFAPGNDYPQKEVIDANGYKIFRLVDDFGTYFTGTELITSRWTDSDGNVWYKTSRGSNNGQKAIIFECLYKLSKSSTVRESEWTESATYSPGAYPTKIDAKDMTYRVYNRAEK